jgi:hypothetical protein
MTDLWVPEDGAPISESGGLGDLAYVNYADLLAALQTDLQLNANTDLLAGTVQEALIDQNGAAAFVQLLTASQQFLAGPFFTSFGVIGANASAGITVTHNLNWLTLSYFGSHDAVDFTLALAPIDDAHVRVEVFNADPSSSHSGPNVAFFVVGHP